MLLYLGATNFISTLRISHIYLDSYIYLNIYIDIDIDIDDLLNNL